jgi:hypothetical protein
VALHSYVQPCPGTGPGRRLVSGIRRTSWVLVAATLWLLPGESPAVVNPVTLIERQIVKPNMLIVFDTSTSMMNSPGDKDVDSNEVGQDCDNGDDQCRMVGKPGRCFYAGTGSAGAGVKKDLTSCTTNSQCRVGICKSGGASCTTDAECTGVANYCSVFANDVCITSGTQSKVKMCQAGMNRCRTSADCASGDTCGNATSRLVLAKRVISGIVSSYHKSVNFGLMTFYQSNYYPYYPLTGAPVSHTLTRFLDRDLLSTYGCWTKKTGPSATCTIEGMLYTRRATDDSSYRVKLGSSSFTTIDKPWCGSRWCSLAAQDGTGYYLGSYYTYNHPTVTLSSTTPIIKSSYLGKTILEGGVHYAYWDPPNEMRNEGNIFGDAKEPEPIDAGDSAPSYCCATCGGRGDTTVAPFMDTSDDPVKAHDMAYAIIKKMDKAGLGGLGAEGFTPTGCTLAFGGSAEATDTNNALSYLQKVKLTDPLKNCRNNYVLMITDGSPNRPYDVACNSAACANTNPTGAGCTCQAVKSAQALASAGIKTFVVGFSNAVTDSYTSTTLNNIAKAGGTGSALFAVQETQLRDHIVNAIYQAAQGSYSTSPAAASSGVQTTDSITLGTMILDTRVDFPGWKGQLIAYETSSGTPTVAWSANTVAFNPAVDADFWKKRNIWTSDGTTMVKFEVNPSTGAITNKHQLMTLGLGATDDEAERVARWMLGDPALKNPAVLGAIINSTPIDIGPPGKSPLPGGVAFYDSHKTRANLTYAGASDGMLHAFFTRNVTVGSKSYLGGQEAFAYIPQTMLAVQTRLFAQGGQLPDPKDHVYGLANSPKVKNLCTAFCDGVSGTPQWKTVLAMAYGFGGTEAFTLDISDPFDGAGVKTATAPAPLMWSTQYETATTTAAYDNDLGLTTSVPAFYYGKGATKDDFRLIFGSYYTDTSTGNQGKVLINAAAKNGSVLQSSHVTPGNSCPTVFGLMSDVAAARNFAAGEETQILAAYFGDTWGNLYRYVPTVGANNYTGSTGTVSTVDAGGCTAPIHYAPAVVQLDRDNSANRPGEIYLVQVTNSALDDDTQAYPASKMIIRRDLANGGNVANDAAFAKITLTAGVSGQLCGVTNAAGTSCVETLPATARPNATPMAVLKKDGTGFVLISTWYLAPVDACNDGLTYLIIQDYTITTGIKTTFATKLASEPITSAVFVGGKLMFVKQTGVTDLTSMLPAAVAFTPGTTGGFPGSAEKFRKLGWMEFP